MSANASSAPEAWKDVRADETIQYTPVEFPEPKPPEPNIFTDFLEWVGNLFEGLSDFFEPLARFFGVSWFVVQLILLALAVAMAAYLLWRLLSPLLEYRIKGKDKVEDNWVPDREEAMALLEDADQLAAEGRFDEATHLLLKRSVGQIAEARPALVEPSSTARELASTTDLPSAARRAFGTIAERVEQSLFALRQLGRDDWQAARAAYAEFALQSLSEQSLNEGAS